LPGPSARSCADLRCGGLPEILERPDMASESRQAIRACTDDLLARHVRYCYERSAFYRDRFNRLGLGPEAIRTVADLHILPFTTKADLASSGERLLCVPLDQVVDVCQTSGTTGEPVTLLQTERDLQRLAYNEYQCFTAAGLTCANRVAVACSLERCFMAGLAYFEGLRRIGACAVRVGAGSPSLLAETVLSHRPFAIVGVPSSLLACAHLLSRRGLDPAGLGVRKLVCIGEPVRDRDLGLSPLGLRLHKAWGAQVLGTYASTEMATSFAECDQGRGGGHILPDLIVVEIVDEAGASVPAGQPGELVATPLQVTGMPLLRLKTGDITTLLTEPCPCGRLTHRLGPVLGRKAQMLKVRGTTVYPNDVFAVLQGLDGVEDYCLEVHEDFELSDRPRVIVGLDKDTSLTADEIGERIRGRLRVRLEVVIVATEEVRRRVREEGRRKPIRVFDYRGRGKDGQA